MDELLKKLLEESEILNDDSKKLIVETFETKVNEAVELAKQETEIKVRAELTEQFVAEKEAIIEALDTKAEEFLKKSLEELSEDIEAFRDLEAEFAARLVEEKKVIAETVKNDMAELIDQLDAFNTKCLEEEFAELEESIEEVKKIKFGMDIFEAVAKTYQTKFSDSNEALNQLKEAEAKLAETEQKLNEASKALNTAKRDQKLSEVLEPLQGRPREVMEAILKNTPTEKLDEAYEKFIGRVLHDVSKSEKESAEAPVLAEGKKEDAVVTAETVVVTGDRETIVESVTDKNEAGLPANALARLRVLSGIND